MLDFIASAQHLLELYVESNSDQANLEWHGYRGLYSPARSRLAQMWAWIGKAKPARLPMRLIRRFTASAVNSPPRLGRSQARVKRYPRTMF